MMGVEPARLTLRQYQAILGEWNARHDPEGNSGPKDFTRLKRAMDAHTVH